ncbi:MAG: helix-hairpin-helix domain-containing protein [bacterium JZ-2024 1]
MDRRIFFVALFSFAAGLIIGGMAVWLILPNSPTAVWVTVEGEVKKPGMYRFSRGARVSDAINRAGGFTPYADVRSLSLSQPLADGMYLLIPRISSTSPQEIDNLIQESASETSQKPRSSTPSAKINLNTATLEELMELPGIGEKTARAILDYRQKVGKFRSIEELKNVKGIGDKKFEKIKDLVTI